MFKAFFKISGRRKGFLLITLLLSLYIYLKMKFSKGRAGFKNSSLKSKTDKEIAEDIGWSIYKVSRFTPWENVCRHQAYQAMILCRCYKIPYEISVGFKKNPETGEIEGHAWTVSSGLMITGFCQPQDYIIQTVYKG